MVRQIFKPWSEAPPNTKINRPTTIEGDKFEAFPAGQVRTIGEVAVIFFGPLLQKLPSGYQGRKEEGQEEKEGAAFFHVGGDGFVVDLSQN